MMNNRSMQENVNEGNKQPPASAKIDDTVMCGYKAILLSPGWVVSLSRILSKSKLRTVKINNKKWELQPEKNLFDGIKEQGIGCVVRFKRRNNIVVSNI